MNILEKFQPVQYDPAHKEEIFAAIKEAGGKDEFAAAISAKIEQVPVGGDYAAALSGVETAFLGVALPRLEFKRRRDFSSVLAHHALAIPMDGSLPEKLVGDQASAVRSALESIGVASKDAERHIAEYNKAVL